MKEGNVRQRLNFVSLSRYEYVTEFLSDVENTMDLSSHESLKSKLGKLKDFQQSWMKALENVSLNMTANTVGNLSNLRQI